MNLIPAWILDYNGDKIGTRTNPYRVIDYVREYERAKHPEATGKILAEVRKYTLKRKARDVAEIAARGEAFKKAKWTRRNMNVRFVEAGRRLGRPAATAGLVSALASSLTHGFDNAKLGTASLV